MRSIRSLSFLSASLVALTLGGAASAAPGLITKRGPFPAEGAAEASSHPLLERAARKVVGDQLELSRGLSFGQAKVVELSRGDRVVKLRQLHKGLPVVHRGVAVTFSGGVARLVSARLESELPDDVTPDVSSELAAAVAEERTGLPVVSDQIALALWPTPDGVRLVWALGAAIPGMPYQPVTVVDAKTGEIIYVYNAVVSLNQAEVFPSNPEKSPVVEAVTLPVGAGETTLQNELIQSLNCIDQQTVRPVDFMGFELDVHTCDLLQTALPDVNGDFLIPPAEDDDPEDAFAEVSMFHHANRAYELFRSWSPTLELNGGQPLPTVSNLRIPQGFDTFDLADIANPDLPLVPFQNAFFAPANPIFSTVFGLNGAAMWFGQGPVNDYSYDGDVVYHELVHAVVNATIQLVGTPHMDEFGASPAPGSMNEGLADYFSSALTGDGDVGEYASKDFAPGSVAIRQLTNDDSCPSAIGGEVHQDATLFSGAIWDVRVGLDAADQASLDEAVFAAMNAAPTGDLSYEDLADLIIEQAGTLVDAATADALTAAFTTRGVLPRCSRILEYEDGGLSGPAALQGLWFALGTQTTGATNPAGDWTPGVVQVHASLPPGSTQLDIAITNVPLGSTGLGGQGTPFAPKFLVRFGADPITFTYGPTETNADVAVVEAAEDGSLFVGSVAVPEGATELHVMVVSIGQLDGAYTDLTLTATTGPTGEGGAGGGGTGGSSEGGSGAGGNPLEDGDDDGCDCRASAGSTSGGGAAIAALALVGLVASRRRRRP
ncbi:MAG: hypothetical protein IPG04_05540 [Polyangiaceae bacterium]|jgi:MYXO-CTERM domain-containing protein|nr:hypothetical protein [Polyangiaceae bacterium]